jgi:hypothetical protein
MGLTKVRRGNGKVYYGARGQAGLHRKNRKRKKYVTSTSNAVKYPHLKSSPKPGTGRSRSSAVSSSYGVSKKSAPKPPTVVKKPVRKPYRVPVTQSALEHYVVTASLGSDVNFEGAAIFNDPGYDQDWFTRGDEPEYGDAFDNSNSLQLGIGSDVTSITSFTERYVETTPVYDAAINLPNTGNYSGIQVRIVEA